MQVKLSLLRLLLPIAFFMPPLFLKGQTKVAPLPTAPDGQVLYMQDVDIPKTTQDALYDRAVHWVISTKTYQFKKIDMIDKEFGRFLASGKFMIDHDEVFISLSVDVKNNKARLKVSRFDYNMAPGNIPIDNLSNQKTKEAQLLIPALTQIMAKFMSSFKDAMLSGTKI